MELSIIIPAYNCSEFIKQSIQSKLRSLGDLKSKTELIIVLDGKDDKAVKIIKDMNLKRSRIIELNKNMGKGYAVRKGMSTARGKYISYIDADSEIDPTIIIKMYKIIKEGKIDGVIPSKLNPRSKVRSSFKRKLISRTYSLLVKLLYHLPLSDTQVGAKLYTKELVSSVIPKCKIDRFAFEIEFLYWAYKLGFRNIKEVPINIDIKTSTTIKFSDGIKAIYDSIRLFFLTLRN